MLSINLSKFWILSALSAGVLTSSPAIAQTLADDAPSVGGALTEVADENKITPVSFPGTLPVKLGVMPTITLPGPQARPPAPYADAPKPQRSEHQKLMISQMNGEVHFKHLQGERIDPARALYVETGKGQSWCECKMLDCTSRVWADSQVSIFPNTDVLYLNKGAVIIKVNKACEAKYTVIAGDFMCRVQASTLRVQRNERVVNFQVLDGTITVFNRLTGEVFKAGQVTH